MLGRGLQFHSVKTHLLSRSDQHTNRRNDQIWDPWIYQIIFAYFKRTNKHWRHVYDILDNLLFVMVGFIKQYIKLLFILMITYIVIWQLLKVGKNIKKINDGCILSLTAFESGKCKQGLSFYYCYPLTLTLLHLTQNPHLSLFIFYTNRLNNW